MAASNRLVPLPAVADSISSAIHGVERAGGMEHVLVTRSDGLPIAHNFPDRGLARHVAAMAAAIVGTGEMATRDLGRGTLRGATIDAEGGRLVCLRAGPDAIVAGLGGATANVGLMLVVLRDLADAVDRALQDWQTEGT